MALSCVRVPVPVSASSLEEAVTVIAATIRQSLEIYADEGEASFSFYHKLAHDWLCKTDIEEAIRKELAQMFENLERRPTQTDGRLTWEAQMRIDERLPLVPSLGKPEFFSAIAQWVPSHLR